MRTSLNISFSYIFVIFYFFLIRPQLKRQRQVEQMISGLKKGDPVVAASGILGTIHKIDGETVVLEIAEGVKINVLRSSITECKSNLKNIESKDIANKTETKTDKKSKAKK